MNDKYGRTLQPCDIVFITGTTKSYDVAYVIRDTAFLIPHNEGEQAKETIARGSDEITISPNSIMHRMAKAGLLSDEDAAKAYPYFSRRAAEEAAEICSVNFTKTQRKCSISSDAKYTFTKGDVELEVNLDAEHWWLEAKKAVLADSYCEEVYAEKFKATLVRELVIRFAVS